MASGAAAPERPEDLGTLYGAEYYSNGFGPVPYSRSETQWTTFFGMIADQMIRALHPQRVLDAGCALGFLVEAFWDRGVAAWGIDISPYAISQVRRDMQPYCQVGSIGDSIEGRYDLITCIEVLEHMPEEQGRRAVANMTAASDTILFSSTPYDVNETTHFNVRPVLWWLEVFREYGFAPDLNFDVSFVCDHAILFRRAGEPLSDEVLRLFSRFIRQKHEIVLSQTARNELQVLEAAHEEIQANLEAANRQLADLIETRAGRGVAAPPPDAEAVEELKDLIRAQSAQIKSLEFRARAIEERGAEASYALKSILESRIWRTLVKGGGLLQKFFG